jgi:hypothetical protein
VELYLHSPNTPLWRGAYLKKKHWDNFTFTLEEYDPPRKHHGNKTYWMQGFRTYGMPEFNATNLILF